MRNMMGLLPFLICLDPGAEGGTTGDAPEASTGVTREELENLFNPPDLAGMDLIDAETLEANIAKATSDPFYLKTTRELRAVYDVVAATPKAERKNLDKEDVTKFSMLRMVYMTGPDAAEQILYYQPPKRKAAAAGDTIPPWQTYIAKLALAKAYPVLMGEIDRLLTEGRDDVIKHSEGLPAAVTDHRSFIELSDRFQVNYVVNDERWKNAAGKDTAVSIGWRCDLFRPEPKKKDEKASVTKPAAETAAPADA